MHGVLKPQMLLALATLVTACAASPKAPEHPKDRADTGDPSLLSLVPDQAAMALVLKNRALETLRKTLDDTPRVKATIVKLSKAQLGVDLTAASGAVAFGVFPEGDGALAVVLALPRPARPKGKPVARYRGRSLYGLDPWVLASIPQGLVLGNTLGVKLALDGVQGRTKGLSSASRLAPLTALDGPQVTLLAAVDQTTLVALEVGTERSDGILQEIEQLTVQYSADGQLVADLKCRPGKALRVKDRISAPLTKGVSRLRRALSQQKHTLPAVQALSLVHPFLRWLRGMEPEIKDHHLVLRTQLPELNMRSLSALFWSFEVGRYMAGMQERRLKGRSSAALEKLGKLSDRARDLLRKHKGDPKTFRYPDSTPWTGDKPCCDGPVPRACTIARKTLDHPTWKALGFAPQGPQYHNYRFVSVGVGDQASFKIEARADLDCDGEQGSANARGDASKRFKEGGRSHSMEIVGELE